MLLISSVHSYCSDSRALDKCTGKHVNNGHFYTSEQMYMGWVFLSSDSVFLYTRLGIGGDADIIADQKKKMCQLY